MEELGSVLPSSAHKLGTLALEKTVNPASPTMAD